MTYRSARWLIVPVAAMSLSACGINSVPTKEEAAKAKWANVEAAYQRRADLIPNLVETAKGAAKIEQSTLEGVIQARASATQVKLSTDDLEDPAKVQAFQQAQGNVSSALGRLLVTVEKYPELKSQARFADLMTQLEGTENRINVTIQDYNGAVQDYNTTIRTFPDIIGAKIVHGAKPMTPYKATSPMPIKRPRSISVSRSIPMLPLPFALSLSKGRSFSRRPTEQERCLGRLSANGVGRRKRGLWAWTFLALFLGGTFASPAAAQNFPKLAGEPVVDQADIIPAAEEAALNTQLKQLQTTTGHQLVVATVNDLEGNDVADYGYKLGRAWGIGDKEKDDGVVFLIAPNERRMNISVGYGLEPVLTDALSGRIIRDVVTPKFKAGDMPGGIQDGVNAIAEQIQLPPEEAAARAAAADKAERDRADDGDIGGLIFIGFIVFFFFILPILSSLGGRGKRHRRHRPWGGAPIIIWGDDHWGGGGSGGSSWGGGGGGGFGGFSGGGGSFGGGGASGGW